MTGGTGGEGVAAAAYERDGGVWFSGASDNEAGFDGQGVGKRLDDDGHDIEVIGVLVARGVEWGNG